MTTPRSVVVYFRDGNLAPIAQIDYFLSLRLVERFMGVGKWVVTAPIGAPGVAELLEATDPGIIVQDSVTKAIVFSGPVDVGPDGALTVVRSVSESNGELVSTIQIHGSCDNVWLSHRIAHPEPLTAGPPWTSSEHDVISGPASTVLLDLIDRNAGPSALTDRQVSGLTLAADPGAGSTITARARYQPLLAYLAELATAGGVGFEVRQRARVLTATASAIRDLSANVAFAQEFGNLAAFEYAVSPATGSFVYGAGQGEGTARAIVVASVAGRRVESFYDRRDLASSDELAAATAVAVTEGVGRTSLKMQPVDTDSCSYGVHYRLGDKVAVLVDGVRTVEVVRVVETAVEGGVMTRTITVGPEDNRGPAALYAGLTTLGRRVRQLERI